MKVAKEVKVSIELNSKWEVEALILTLLNMPENMDKDREVFIKKLIEELKK